MKNHFLHISENRISNKHAQSNWIVGVTEKRKEKFEFLIRWYQYVWIRKKTMLKVCLWRSLLLCNFFKASYHVSPSALCLKGKWATFIQKECFLITMPLQHQMRPQAHNECTNIYTIPGRHAPNISSIKNHATYQVELWQEPKHCLPLVLQLLD